MDTNLEAFARALEAANGELGEVQAERSRLETTLKSLQYREQTLNAMIRAIHELMPAPETQGNVGDAPPAQVHPDVEDQGDGRSVQGATGEEVPLPQPPALQKRVSPTSSPYRVGLILRDARVPMRRADIVRAYESRGWVPATWRDATANVTQAVRRAEKYGWARRVGNGLFISTQISDAQLPAGSLDLEGAQP